MAFDSTLGTAHALASNPPQQPLTLVAVGGGSGSPHLKVVRCGAGDGVYEGLEGLLIDMALLQGHGGEKVWGQRSLWAKCEIFPSNSMREH